MAMNGAFRRPPPRRVAVLGAGNMGAQIAAHVANVGIPVLLLDQTVALARQGFDRLRSVKPSPFYTSDRAALVRTGGFDTDLSRIADADWIVEAVVERLDVKQQLLAGVDAARRPGSIVTSNTSGLSIAEIARDRSADLQRHWLGTHFFNPPRYLRLVEVVPTLLTDPDVVQHVRDVLEYRLGKGVVIAKDTPSFIANRLGIFALMQAIRAVASGRYTIEEVDAITGPPLGRPKSATFRTMDIAGLDVLALVARDLDARLPGSERAHFELPALIDQLVRNGWLGEKTGQGFYKREPGAQGHNILALDPATLTYRSSDGPRIPSLGATRTVTDSRERVRALFAAHDKAGAFLRETLPAFLLYAARVLPEIAHSMDDVDRAMQWGFGWELGPFELFDALGIETVVGAWQQGQGSSTDVPPVVQEALQAGRTQFRSDPIPPSRPDFRMLSRARRAGSILKSNGAASLIDLGDYVLCVELHSKMNVIGSDTLQMLECGVETAEREFAALVVATEAQHFSAGADLALLLLEAREANWDEIDLMIRRFQHATTRLRTATVPVVAAVCGLTLGGGCEILLHACQVQAAAETYIGLVETGVGLIPAGGGTKEMLARAVEATGRSSELLTPVRTVFETVGLAKTSSSALDAIELRLLRETDGVTINKERLVADAKARALAIARQGHTPAQLRPAIRVGGADVLAALTLGLHLGHRGGRLSDHDVVVGRKLAWVLAGGNLPHEAQVSESYILDLEREAFLSLCGEPKTLDRIQHTLTTGKPLRN
jgi:3-hydroxyacyl-CoA dehydrogenase